MACGNDALCISAELFLSMTIVIIVARLAGVVFRYFRQVATLTYFMSDLSHIISFNTLESKYWANEDCANLAADSAW